MTFKNGKDRLSITLEDDKKNIGIKQSSALGLDSRQLGVVYSQRKSETLFKMMEYDRALSSFLHAQELFLRVQQELRMLDFRELEALLEWERSKSPKDA